jgi:pyruvate formate lyase activating enzyme
LMDKCPVCFRHCEIKEGGLGFCKARGCVDGKIVPLNYGLITSSGLDPIEKKPLRRFHPGSKILSVGSYGCNLSCPFCQNFEISQFDLSHDSSKVSPDSLIELALELKANGNIGIAFTYNEPLVSYEFVRDAAKLAKEKNLLTVLVTNGECSIEVLDEILPYIDAMNIDLKGFSQGFYSYVGGSFEMVRAFIEHAYKKCHVELTSLVIPGKNDSVEMMEEEAKWIASLDKGIPLHLSRYFPRYKEKIPPTEEKSLLELKLIAEKYLDYVYLGNL